MNIRLFAPYLGEDEINEIRDAFSRSWVGLGEKVSKFESDFSDFIGCRKSIAVNSATAGLHLALSAFRFPEGKKVLVPDITFASTAFAPIYNRLNPVFVDVNHSDITMSIDDLERKYDKDCVAIIAVHYGGQPAKMEKINEFAKKKNLVVIEDCAHTIGTEYKGVKLGLWGNIGVFSFEEKKAMTTGDGGMICSNDEELLKDLIPRRWLGIDKDTWKTSFEYINPNSHNSRHWYYDINELGFKYNMNDLAAAIGIVQLKRLRWMNSERSKRIKEYLQVISGLKHIKPLLPFNPDENSYWLFGVRCEKRDELILHLKSNGIATGVHYYPLNMMNYFKEWNLPCPVAEKVWESFVTLPLHVHLTTEETGYISEKLISFERKYF